MVKKQKMYQVFISKQSSFGKLSDETVLTILAYGGEMEDIGQRILKL